MIDLDEWHVDDCMGQVSLRLGENDKTASVSIRLDEDDDWSTIFLTVNDLKQLALTAEHLTRELEARR